MARNMYLVTFICVLGIYGLQLVEGTKDDKELVRKLSVEENPGCPVGESFCSNGTLIHIRSDSETDTIHFVWNFFGCPTLLLARTQLGANLSIDWTSFISGTSGSAVFDPPETLYTFGWSLTTIWTFLDEKDEVEMNKVNASGVFGHDTKNFYWAKDDKDSVVSEDLVKFSMIAKDYDGQTFGEEGYIKITVQVHSKEGYGTVLPYLRHNGNSSQVDISLNKIDLNNTMTPKTRIGLGYLLVQQVPNLTGDISVKDKIYVQKTKTLDDENSPGVFEMHSLRTPVFNSYDQSYLEWKPVSYTGIIRDIADSVDVHIYDLEDQSPIQLDDSFLWSFYGNNISTLIAQRANISFGTQGDGFFNATPHISWSYLAGYGPPPSDTVSMLVIMTLAVGLGIPAIIIIIAIIYLFTKKLSTPKDDLLLGR